MKLNFFKSNEMLAYYRSLKCNKDIIQDIQLVPKKKILIMTHDDKFDQEFYDYAQEHDADCTFFILANRCGTAPANADIQFHWNMGSKYGIADQLKIFKDRMGFQPWANRNHRLYWRETHLNLACLAYHGIKHDSSQMGVGSFLHVAQQRVLPIVETRLNIVDWPYIDVTMTPTCTYSLASPETLFHKGVTPVTALFHPQFKDKTRWKDTFLWAKKYGYKIMSIAGYHDYLKQNLSNEAEDHFPR